MNKERLILHCLILGVVLGAAASSFAGGNERRSQEPFNPTATNENFVETADGEEAVEPETIESVLAYLKNLPNPQILPMVEEMERWYREGRIYQVSKLADEQPDFAVGRGRFVGTWVTRGEEWEFGGLRLQVSKDYLKSRSVRDLAINLYANALFAKNSEALIAGESVEELLDWARQKARADFETAFQAISSTDYPRKLADGSLDFGNGVIGPSQADIQRSAQSSGK